MFLRSTQRKKNGKTHVYWNNFENKRLDDGRVVQGQVLYLGEINSSQIDAWRRAIEVVDESTGEARTLALFPEGRRVAAKGADTVQVRLSEMRLCRPRQWGAGSTTFSSSRSKKPSRPSRATSPSGQSSIKKSTGSRRASSSRSSLTASTSPCSAASTPALASGLTARSALEKFAAVQMIDIHLPTTDGCELRLTRYTQPEPELQLLLKQMKLVLPRQPPAKIYQTAVKTNPARSEDLFA